MGFLDSLIGDEEKSLGRKEYQAENVFVEKKSPQVPFRVATSFLPMRLSVAKSNSVNLVVKLTNVSNDKQIVSVDAMVPKDALLGFDQSCINKIVEKRVGDVSPGETKEVAIPVWANNQTREGSYDVGISVYAHYQDYNKVIASVKRKTSLRVV